MSKVTTYKSKLTDEQQKLVRTPEFKKWFGDWELLQRAKQIYKTDVYGGIYKRIFGIDTEQALFELSVQIHSSVKDMSRGFSQEILDIAHALYPNTNLGDEYKPVVSKVVDENGEPLVVYHGFLYYSKKDLFTEFKKLPAFFSTNRRFAESYAETKSFDGGLDADTDSYACFLNIKNLFDPKDENVVSLANKKLPEKVNVSHGTMWFLDADLDKEDVVEQMSGIVTIYPDHMTDDILKANVGDVLKEKVAMSQYEERILLYKDEDWAYTASLEYFDKKMEKEVADYINEGSSTTNFDRKQITYKGQRFYPYVVDKETYRYKLNEEPIAVEFFDAVNKYKKYFIENITTLPRDDDKRDYFTVKLKDFDKYGYTATLSVKKRNLKSYKTEARDNWTMFENETVQKFLHDNNFGGWIAFEKGDKTYAVYEPQNIKLADGVNTTFDIKSNDIRYKDGGEICDFVIIPNEQTPKVPKIDDIKLFIEKNKTLLNNYLSFCESLSGAAGLSANQVSVNGKRLNHKFFGINDMSGWRLIFNPVIDEYIGDKHEKDEGCLTWEGKRILAMRSPKVKVSYYTIDGKKIEGEEYSGFKGQVWQHETDHLNGVKQNVKETFKEGGAIDAVKPIVNQYGFYSPIEKRLLEFKQDRASVNKWKDIVGVNTDEAKFTGLANYLNSKKPNENLLKIELLNFIRDNNIELIQVIKNNEKTFLDEVSIKQRPNGTYGIVYKDSPDEFVNDDEFDTEEELKDNYENEEIYSGNDVPYKTKYSQYVLLGEAENYTELLVTLPNEAQKNRLFYNKLFNILSEQVKERVGIKPDSVKWNTFNLYDYKKLGALNTDELHQLNYIDSLSHIKHDTFSTPHWDERNILVHLRYDIRYDSNGHKVLFINELQSDWGQRGKKVGFKGKYNIEELKAQLVEAETEYNKLDFVKLKLSEIWETEEAKRVEDLKEKIHNEEALIPLAPFVTDTNKWVKLGLKFAIQQAALNDAKHISWMTGEQENNLYDLSKSLSKISWWQVGDDENGWGITTYDKQNKIVLKERDTNLKKIEKFLGKDITEKIKNHEGYTERVGQATYGELIGDDLKLSGSGMIGFYGSINKGEHGIIGSVLKSLVKELTGKQSPIIEININEKNITFRKSLKGEAGEAVAIDNNGNVVEFYGDYEQGKKHFEKYNTASVQFAIDVTPELKKSVEEGLPMFKVGGQIKNPYSICTVSLGKAIGTQKRSEWTPAQLHKFEGCVLKVKKEMNDGGLLFTVLYKMDDKRFVVYSDKEGYTITINDDARYIELWHGGKRIGHLEAREHYLNNYHGYTGKFLSIQAAYVDEPHQNKGFGLKMYQVLKEFSDDDVLGFFSDLSNRQNKKVIPRIYSHFDNEIVGDYHIVTYHDGGIVSQILYFSIFNIEDGKEVWHMVGQYNVNNQEEIDTVNDLIEKAEKDNLKVKAITKKEYDDYDLGDEITIDEKTEFYKKKENDSDGSDKFEKGGSVCKCKFANNRVPSKHINEHLLSISK